MRSVPTGADSHTVDAGWGSSRGMLVRVLCPRAKSPIPAYRPLNLHLISTLHALPCRRMPAAMSPPAPLEIIERRACPLTCTSRAHDCEPANAPWHARAQCLRISAGLQSMPTLAHESQPPRSGDASTDDSQSSSASPVGRVENRGGCTHASLLESLTECRGGRTWKGRL